MYPDDPIPPYLTDPVIAHSFVRWPTWISAWPIASLSTRIGSATICLAHGHLPGAPAEAGSDIGFALFFHNYSTFLARPGIYLEDLFVKPEHRGQGHGKALPVALARWAVQRDCGRLEWAVLDWNEPSIHFYQALGDDPPGRVDRLSAYG